MLLGFYCFFLDLTHAISRNWHTLPTFHQFSDKGLLWGCQMATWLFSYFPICGLTMRESTNVEQTSRDRQPRTTGCSFPFWVRFLLFQLRGEHFCQNIWPRSACSIPRRMGGHFTIFSSMSLQLSKISLFWESGCYLWNKNAFRTPASSSQDFGLWSERVDVDVVTEVIFFCPFFIG